MLKQETINIEDTNLANYDSPEAKQARKDAAKSDKQYQGVGEKPGLIIWRVENTRTENDVPNFGINRWPESQYGQFFSGDSYIVLNSYLDNRKLLHDVHFWLGKDSSQDEVGVAAYKSVEIDDLLDGAPVQHREVQGSESKLFKSYFKNGIIYMDGGHASGFRHASAAEYKPRMFHVKSDSKKRVTAYEVAPKISSMNQGDVFILDLGTKIYNFAGDSADPFEKMKGSVLAANLRMSRGGSVTVLDQPDNDFWRQVGGSAKDIPLTMVEPPKVVEDSQQLDINNVGLYRLTDESGSMQFIKVHQGRVYPSMLRAKDVFIIDSGPEIFVWIGVDSSRDEQAQGMNWALKYLKNEGKPTTLPITRVMQNETNKAFDEIVYAGKVRKGWLARSVGAPEHDPTLDTIEAVMNAATEIFSVCTGERDIAQQVEREWNIVDRAIFDRQQEEDATPANAKELNVRI